MNAHLLSWLAAPVAFTVQADQASELAERVIARQQGFIAKLGAGFLPGLVGAIFGAGMIWGTQLMNAKVTEATLNTIRQANTAEHTALANFQRSQDERMNRIQADAAVAAQNAASATRDAAELRGRLEAVERLLALQLQRGLK